MSQQDYIEDPLQWGGYSYVTIEQVVNDYLAARDQDDFTFNTPRYKVVYQAKRALREFYYDVLQEVKAIELDLGSNLQVILPEDYVNYVRISYVEDGILYPLAENKRLSISISYLQDNEANILFDNDGEILESNGIPNSSSGTTKKYDFCEGYNFSPNLNLSSVHPNGSYRIDKDSGVIRFSSEVETKTIVLEYISDGLFVGEESARIHKFAEHAISDFIYFALIKRRRNVPANEKHRAMKEYHNSRRIAKRRLNQANREEIIRAMKGASVWIKD